MKTLIDGISRSYPAREAAEAISHIGDIKLPLNGNRLFLGLVDGICLKDFNAYEFGMHGSPYNNVVCYYNKKHTEINFMICGRIIGNYFIEKDADLLAELRAIIKEQV